MTLLNAGCWNVKLRTHSRLHVFNEQQILQPSLTNNNNVEATGSDSSCQRPSVCLSVCVRADDDELHSTRLHLTFILKWCPEDQTSCCVSVKQTKCSKVSAHSWSVASGIQPLPPETEHHFICPGETSYDRRLLIWSDSDQ